MPVGRIDRRYRVAESPAKTSLAAAAAKLVRDGGDGAAKSLTSIIRTLIVITFILFNNHNPGLSSEQQSSI